jgi:hypothetical protein
VSWVLWDWDHCSGKAQKQLYGKLQTHPLVREGAPYQDTRNRQAKNKNWSCSPDSSPTRRQTGRLTVGHKFNLNSFLFFVVSQDNLPNSAHLMVIIII